MPTLRPKRRPAERVDPPWEVPDNIYDGPFKLDSLTNDLQAGSAPGLLGRWRPRSNPIGFARRGLEVAIMQGATERQHALGPVIDDWERTTLAFRKADRALAEALSTLVGYEPSEPSDLYVPLRSSRVFTSATLDVKETELRSSAEALIMAASSIKRIRERAQNATASLRSQRKHEGDAAFRAFAATIGETWVHLTGQPPAASTEGGPFVRFLAAAWSDAGGSTRHNPEDDHTVFLAGARHARSQFPPDKVARIVGSQSLPFWT